MISRAQLVALAATVLGLVGAVALVAVAGVPAPEPDAEFAASRVTVAVRITGSGDHRTVEVVLAPDAPDLHLYGPDLPLGGVDGAGRPTRVEVVGGGWQALRSSVEPTPFPTTLAGFSAPFSVLPPGPVTVRVPIVPTPGADPASVVLAVTYMACSSDGRCFAPVEARRVDVTVREP